MWECRHLTENVFLQKFFLQFAAVLVSRRLLIVIEGFRELTLNKLKRGLTRKWSLVIVCAAKSDHGQGLGLRSENVHIIDTGQFPGQSWRITETINTDIRLLVSVSFR